ncbi:MAG: 2-amino-4-hydroxy-6-hydroxymethyldihydropteridine diphosphokinase [Burkholderiales bacterium]|nr:2-amino-4-hydroxy-6-hydroxymethyldihydropteridine diphosphokinase [Burkholderiales bacterium]
MTAPAHRACVALGANIGEPRRQIEAGFAALAALPGTRLLARSSLYRSAPVGYTDQPDFINAVAMIETTLAPHALLEAVLAIERVNGRVREFPNAPRTLDLDIVIYGDVVLQEPGLTIPHARMLERAFVMVPLAEIAPDMLVPGHGKVGDLVRHLDAAGVAQLRRIAGTAA